MPTRRSTWTIVAVASMVMLATAVRAQDLDPRAYVHVPIDMTYAVGGSMYSTGGVVTDPTLPLEDLQADIINLSVGAGRTFDLFGMTSQVFVMQAYSWGRASATVFDEPQSVTRRGFADTRIRFSVLPIGAPALTAPELATRPRHTILGASLTVIAPTGAFNPEWLINIGTNRWSFKPELALSLPVGDSWLVDTYAALWLFTSNSQFYPGTSERTQDPMAAFQGHVSYQFTRQMWAAVNMTFYVGGTSHVNGVASDDLQRNIRLGGTFAVPIGNTSSIKIAASTGAVVRVGANFTSVSLAWQSSFF